MTSGPIAGGAAVNVLPAREFAAGVAALPLVSVDWVLTNPDGELLLGRRINAPAQGWWFTPGGRIRKNEVLAQALRRVACGELGLAPELCERAWAQARLMGAWDHFYPDSAFSPSVPTHYVNLPYWWPLSWADVALLRLPIGEQHSAWQWLPLADAGQSPLVHAYVRPYAAWVLGRDADANAFVDHSSP
ncbi:NUDIX domain-containing protein [Polaromonas jejuensis]|uniref:NUDIX domain-containing protein n=1 Tax=Polaromonas jejuensis TaxID=457502 RepID=A0ABW0Q6B4_9BURK|nr:GDP-mannose mannosyl hydrolase [Polaromonas jejuensis]